MPDSLQASGVDLIGWPVLGRFLSWRHARIAMQIPVLILAGLAIFDGLAGPSLAPKNFATVSIWLHYRGLVVLALLVAGNLFCMACPFMLTRSAGRWMRERLGGHGRPVPAALRNKWLAVGLIVAFFVSYELFSLWASPWLTAWIAIGYFLCAFVVDTIFQGAAFCKYVCPLGHFNFFGSLISPLEVQVRSQQGCAACRTKDCIQPLAHGCELWLFQPRKTGNMDCTFCLDCVHACPYDNIGLIARTPTAELWDDPFRSGIGRFSRRSDLAALVAVLTFGSFMNAFAMIRPVYGLRALLARSLGTASEAPGLLVIFALGLVVLPLILLTITGLASRRLSGAQAQPLATEVRRYIFALVPLGFGMWLAHYSFHFLTGGLTVVPVAQSFLTDVGVFAGQVQWGLGPVVPGEWLFPIEAVFLYLGGFGSLVAAFQIAQRSTAAPGEGGAATHASPMRVLGAAAPWMILCLFLLGYGLWILIQPMEMRGTLLARPIAEWAPLIAGAIA